MTATLAHQVRVEQLVFWRNRSGVFFTFFFPLLLLVIFASNADTDSLRVLVPGIAALTTVSTCFQGLAIGLTMHREQGVLKRIIATPLPLRTLVLAKVVSAALVALLEIVLVLVAGRWFYDLGWPQHGWSFAAALVVGVLAFSAMGIALTAIVPSAESAPAVTNAIYLPMMFVSGVFYSVASEPHAVQVLAKVLPMYHLATPMRDAWIGNVTHLGVHLAVLGAWGIGAAAYAARRMRWVPRHEG